MRKSSQALRLAVIAFGTVASISASYAEESLRLTPGIARSVVLKGAAEGNFSSIIGDPKIADVTFGPKNTLWFVGLTEGTTNIIVLENSTGKEMYSAIITVENGNQVRVHNKVMLTSYTIYRCGPACTFEREVTAAEPAPLPRGHLQSSTVYEGLSSVMPPAGPSSPPPAP